MNFNNNETKEEQIKNLIGDVLTGIKKVETTIEEKIEPLKKQLEEQKEYNLVIKYGLEGFRNSIIKSKEYKATYYPQTWIYQTVQKKHELRYPHRKILEFLSKQYDYDKQKFEEVNFGTIVRECKVGKNRAKEYLRYLEEKGMIKQRNDGYRVWYKIDVR